jgi:uracil-DNA glycosylase family 4
VTVEERRQAFEAIAAEVSFCTRCRLSAGRTMAVPGEGNTDTEVMFVGEGPGFNEDQQGRPFVGAAGGFLNELLRTIGWKRDEVFITNVVKCRPPGNRDPEPDEIAACAPYLHRQLEALDPALVVTLGRFSMQTFMPGARIGQAHGTMRSADPSSGAPDAVAFAMYHPAAAFRQQALRDTMKLDMCSIPDALLKARAARAARAGSGAIEPAVAVEPKPQVEPAVEPTAELETTAELEPTAELETTAAAGSQSEPEPAVELETSPELMAEALVPVAAGWADRRPDDPADPVPRREEPDPSQLSLF